MEDGQKANITNISGDNTDIGKKQCLNIDFDLIFASERDESPTELIVVPSTAGDGDQCRRRKEKRRKSVADSSSASSGDDLARMSEAELKSTIKRNTETIAKLGDKLPDKGAKLNTHVQLLKEELERRKHPRSQEVSWINLREEFHHLNPMSILSSGLF